MSTRGRKERLVLDKVLTERRDHVKRVPPQICFDRPHSKPRIPSEDLRTRTFIGTGRVGVATLEAAMVGAVDEAGRLGVQVEAAASEGNGRAPRRVGGGRGGCGCRQGCVQEEKGAERQRGAYEWGEHGWMCVVE